MDVLIWFSVFIIIPVVRLPICGGRIDMQMATHTNQIQMYQRMGKIG